MAQWETVIHYANKLPYRGIFVETGTNTGDMVDKVKDLFKEIYSVEINYKSLNLSRNRFKQYPHIHILWGDSGKVIPKKADLYWLDAHNNPPNADCPILEELKRIEKFKYILIDDFGSMTGREGFPQAQEIETIVREKWNIVNYQKLGQITVIDWAERNAL